MYCLSISVANSSSLNCHHSFIRDEFHEINWDFKNDERLLLRPKNTMYFLQAGQHLIFKFKLSMLLDWLVFNLHFVCFYSFLHGSFLENFACLMLDDSS